MHTEQKDLNDIIKILGSKKLTPDDVKFLFDKYRHIHFLKDLLDQGKKNIVYDLLVSLKLQQSQENEVVFYAGEKSSKFYLLISGQVRILISENNNQTHECPIPGFFEKHSDDKRLFPSKTNNFEFKNVATLKEGQTFGELGILHDKPRMATVVTAMPSIFGVICADDFKRILEPTMIVEAEEKLKYLKPLMEYECSYEEYWRLAAFFTKVNLIKYKTLYEENESFNKVFFVALGMVKLEKLVNLREYENLAKVAISPNNIVSSAFLPVLTLRNQKSKAELPSTNTIRLDPFKTLSLNPNDLLQRKVTATTYQQPIVTFGQNQFLNFKEILEGHTRYCFSARVCEQGIAYSIDFDNIKKCFTEFASFKRAFFNSSAPILDQINVT